MTDIAARQHRLGLLDADGALVAPETFRVDDDGVIPNNTVPALRYRGAPTSDEAAGDIEALLRATDWPPQWRGGVFAFQHYHATAHEVLGVWGGSAEVQLGGELGPVVTLEAGDIVLLPAGVGHCRHRAGAGFAVVGGYPANQPDWDMCRADPAVHDAAAERIARVPLPPADPVAGPDGPLVRHWGAR
jgi:uncharacterized protein YjlB